MVDFDPHCSGEISISSEVRLGVVLSRVCCCISLLLCFFIVVVHALVISIPLSLLMFSGWSWIWIVSLILWVYQCEILINKFHLIPKRLVASLICMFGNGRGLGMGKTYKIISLVLFYPLLHWPTCFADADLATFTRNSVYVSCCLV